MLGRFSSSRPVIFPISLFWGLMIFMSKIYSLQGSTGITISTVSDKKGGLFFTGPVALADAFGVSLRNCCEKAERAPQKLGRPPPELWFGLAVEG